MIRLATLDDAPAVHAVYAPIVRDTAISFELAPPPVEEVRARIAKVLEQRPWLVAERAGAFLGYAYATAWRERPAYRWTTEVSVYVAETARRTGVGRALYTALFGALALQGYMTAVAGATLGNPGTVALHEGLGFERVGVFRAVGHKHGAWHDVVWWQRPLRPPAPAPAEPRPLREVVGTPAWEQALAEGARLLG